MNKIKRIIKKTLVCYIVLMSLYFWKIGGINLDSTITTILGFVVSMIPVVTVIVKLNGTITKLNVTIQVLNTQMESSQKDRGEIHRQLNDHETRITVIENNVVKG